MENMKCRDTKFFLLDQSLPCKKDELENLVNKKKIESEFFESKKNFYLLN